MKVFFILGYVFWILFTPPTACERGFSNTFLASPWISNLGVGGPAGWPDRGSLTWGLVARGSLTLGMGGPAARPGHGSLEWGFGGPGGVARSKLLGVGLLRCDFQYGATLFKQILNFGFFATYWYV